MHVRKFNADYYARGIRILILALIGKYPIVERLIITSFGRNVGTAVEKI